MNCFVRFIPLNCLLINVSNISLKDNFYLNVCRSYEEERKREVHVQERILPSLERKSKKRQMTYVFKGQQGFEEQTSVQHFQVTYLLLRRKIIHCCICKYKMHFEKYQMHFEIYHQLFCLLSYNVSLLFTKLFIVHFINLLHFGSCGENIKIIIHISKHQRLFQKYLD